jgi:hypothetical protein
MVKSMTTKITKVFIVTIALLTSTATLATEVITVHKTETCGCCHLWVKYLEENGFEVKAIDRDDLYEFKEELGIKDNLWSCHTALIGGYIVEGHVSVEDIKRLLAEKPDAMGITVPNMPMGSPGMEVPGRKGQPYASFIFTKDGKAKVYKIHTPK